MSNQLVRKSGVKSFTTGAVALAEGVHVKLTAGLAVVAGAADVGVGVTLAEAAIGEPVAVALFGSGETAFVAAFDNAITAGQKVVAAAAGRFDGGVATGTYLGVALEDSTAQDHLIEVILGVPSVTVV